MPVHAPLDAAGSGAAFGPYPEVIEVARSAVGSRLISAYHRPALILNLLNGWVRRLGEPLRSSFTPPAMRSLLARFEFSVVRDEDLGTIGTGLAPEIGKATRSMRHLRIVTADRR